MSIILFFIRLVIVFLSFVLPWAYIVHDDYYGNYKDWLFGGFIGFTVSFCMSMILFVVL